MNYISNIEMFTVFIVCSRGIIQDKYILNRLVKRSNHPIFKIFFTLNYHLAKNNLIL